MSAQKARIVSAPAALLCPESTRGKDPWSFSPRGSPFSFKTRQKQNAEKTHAIRNDKRRQKHATRAKSPHSAPLFPYAVVPQRQNARTQTQDATHAATKARKNTQSAATKVATQSAQNKNPAQPNFSHAGFPDFKTITDYSTSATQRNP